MNIPEHVAKAVLKERLGLEPYPSMDPSYSGGRPCGGRLKRVIVRGEERVLVQGITGRQATYRTARMQEYGTRIVAGVSPRKAGITHCGAPVHRSAKTAIEATGFEVAVMFVPEPRLRTGEWGMPEPSFRETGDRIHRNARLWRVGELSCLTLRRRSARPFSKSSCDGSVPPRHEH